MLNETIVRNNKMMYGNKGDIAYLRYLENTILKQTDINRYYEELLEEQQGIIRHLKSYLDDPFIETEDIKTGKRRKFFRYTMEEITND